MEKPTLAYFPTRSLSGIALQKEFCELAQNRYNFEVKVYYNPNQLDFALAVVNYDIVVFDATIEKDLKDCNYNIATEQPKSMEHILVVSRTYLPINFFGFYEGGAPDYSKHKVNNEIIDWLMRKIEDLRQKLPRTKTIISNTETQFDLYNNTCKQLMDTSYKIKQKQMKSEGQIFISYRGKYYNDVMTLKMRIESGEFHQGIKKSVRVIPNGVLAWENELLTTQRRWGVLSKIDRMILTAEEVWVYNTPDYFESWWTQGEIVTLNHRNEERTEEIKLRIFNVAKNQLDNNIPNIYKPKLNKQQAQRIARWYSNSDDLSQGPELVEKMRTIRAIVNIVPNAWLKRYITAAYSNPDFKKYMSSLSVYSDDIDMYEIMEVLKDPYWVKEYYNDYVWSKEFWEYPLLQCIHSKSPSGYFDIDDFLYTRKPLHIKLSPKQLEKGINKRQLVCPRCENCPDKKCKAVFEIKKDDNPRYLWMPTRMGVLTSGEGGSGLKPLPTFTATCISSVRQT